MNYERFDRAVERCLIGFAVAACIVALVGYILLRLGVI
jgi:hypothetical protein